MAGWIKMRLGRKVGLSPRNIVLDGTPAALPQKEAEPSNFGQTIVAPNGCMDQDGTRYGGRPRPIDVVLDGDPALPQLKGARPPVSAHIYCGQTAGWMKMPLGTEVDLGQGHIVLDGDPAGSPAKGAHHPPLFSAHVYCNHGRPSQLLLSSCYYRPLIVLRGVCVCGQKIGSV